MGRLDGVGLPQLLGYGGACPVYQDTGSLVGCLDGVGLLRLLGTESSEGDDEGSPVDDHWQTCLATVEL